MKIIPGSPSFHTANPVFVCSMWYKIHSSPQRWFISPHRVNGKYYSWKSCGKKENLLLVARETAVSAFTVPSKELQYIYWFSTDERHFSRHLQIAINPGYKSSICHICSLIQTNSSNLDSKSILQPLSLFLFFSIIPAPGEYNISSPRYIGFQIHWCTSPCMYGNFQVNIRQVLA